MCLFLTVPWAGLQCEIVVFPGQTRNRSFFVCFVALRPKSTAMVIAGRSVHLTTLFPGKT